MIKLLLAGLWVCLVTLGATYGVVVWYAPGSASHDAHAAGPPAAGGGHEAAASSHGGGGGGGGDAIKTRMISVPIVADNAIQGYVMAQFAFTVDGKVLKQLPVKPDAYLVDEAFKTIFAGKGIDFRQFKKQDLPGLTKDIAEGVNKRLGVRLIGDVLVQELNYIPKDQVRGGQKF